MRSGISQSPKDNYFMILLNEVPRTVMFVETEKQMVAGRGWGRGHRAGWW